MMQQNMTNFHEERHTLISITLWRGQEGLWELPPHFGIWIISISALYRPYIIHLYILPPSPSRHGSLLNSCPFVPGLHTVSTRL